MLVDQSLPARRRLLASFLAITVIPVALLVWLTWRIFDQDRALERQTLRDRMEQSADLIVAALQRDLALLEDHLADSGRVEANRDALVVSFVRGRVTVRAPGRLLFYPQTPTPDLALESDVFRAGEALEFQQHDYPQAIAAFRKLAQSDDRSVRAAALVRLARVLYKNKRADKALAAYDELARLGDVPVEGTPAELIARDSRCALLAELRRSAELAREALALDADLSMGRWQLDRGTYLFHADRTRRWIGTTSPAAGHGDTSLALAAATEQRWLDWKRANGDVNSSGREAVWVNQIPVSMIWHSTPDSLIALIAGPRFMQQGLDRALAATGMSVSLSDAAGNQHFGKRLSAVSEYATRNMQDTHLPWTVRVGSASPAGMTQLAGRRRLLLGGLALTALLTIMGGYFTARATARELAVAKLESDFVSAVSHEFRTPLTSLRHLTELLKDGAVTSEERRQRYYAVMSRETERLHRMVEGLLDFGRMEAGRREYSFETLDPVDLVETVIDDFRADIAHTGRRIDSKVRGLASNCRRVRVDREAISHAVRNLLDNAVKYSPESSAVHIELGDLGERVAIRVRDEGVGIAAGEQAAIFDKFVRGSASRTMNVKGSGIGLAMARHIVRAHGGDITVESKTGHGSTLTLSLPWARVNGAAATA